MTYEEYRTEKEKLEAQLAALKQRYFDEAEVRVGDIIVGTDGNEYIIRKMRVWIGEPEPEYVSKKKKDGNWSEQNISVYNIRGWNVLGGGEKAKIIKAEDYASETL